MHDLVVVVVVVVVVVLKGGRFESKKRSSATQKRSKVVNESGSVETMDQQNQAFQNQQCYSWDGHGGSGEKKAIRQARRLAQPGLSGRDD
jgi:hypothetical protein